MPDRIPNNAYAFGLFVLAAGVAIFGAIKGSKDLLAFAGTVATAGGVVFQGKGDKATA